MLSFCHHSAPRSTVRSSTRTFRVLVGAVLVCGLMACSDGSGDGSAVAEVVELTPEEPVVRERPPTQPLLLPEERFEGARRSFHTASHLPGGALLIAGGLGEAGPLDTAWLYEPDTELFRRQPNLHRPRFGHTTTRLPGLDGLYDTEDDPILLLGGSDGERLLDDGELYLPPTTPGEDGRFFRLEGFLPLSLARHQATLLSLDNVDPVHPYKGAAHILVVGGVTDELGGDPVLVDGSILVEVQLEERADGLQARLVLHPMAQPRFGRVEHSLTLLPGEDTVPGTADDRILALGGYGSEAYTGASSHVILGNAEVYEPLTDSWTLLSDPDGLLARRRHRTVLLDDGDVLALGGTSHPPGPGEHRGLVTDTVRLRMEYLRPRRSTLHPSAPLPTPRLEPGVTMLPDGTLLIYGGFTGHGQEVVGEPVRFIADVLGNPEADRFEQLAQEALLPRVFHSQTYLVGLDERQLTEDDGVLLLGGLSSDGSPTDILDIIYPFAPN